MINKLQRKSLSRLRILGYCLSLFVGLTLVLILLQFYIDSNKIISQTGILSKDIAVVSKKVSLLKSLNKDRIYFSEEEKIDMENQSFIEAVHNFESASFRIMIEFSGGDGVPLFRTDLFFESIPADYLEVDANIWHWNQEENYVPIIVPKDYINLYNFGFAESQGLPVISEATIRQVKFDLVISGNGQKHRMRCGIAGFSSEINTILVPSDFLDWANPKFGNGESKKASRLLIEINDTSDPGLGGYFQEKNYAINEKEIERARSLFFFKTVLGFAIFIGIIIVVLAVQMMLLAIYLILQKNKEQMNNLYLLGYSLKRIGAYYRKNLILFTGITAVLSYGTASWVRLKISNRFSDTLQITPDASVLLWMSIIFGVILIALVYFLIENRMKRIILD